MSCRVIIETITGVKIHSSIKTHEIIVEYADGQTDLQTPLDFIRNNPVFNCLTTGQQETLKAEIIKKTRYLRNKNGLNDD